MRGYDRDEYEDYDDYGEYGEDEEEGGEAEGYEEEEEEKRKPTAEELDYLQLRERIKEQIRKKRQKGSISSISKFQENNKKTHADSYGSFFGPSQPVIAQRVIQESKSLLENKNLALRMANSLASKKNSSSTNTGTKNGVHQKMSRVKNELQMKVQKLKDTRDYSFLLSDDAEPPAPPKEPERRYVSASSSEARSAQMMHKSKQLSSFNGRSITNRGEERKSMSTNGQIQSKTVPNKSSSIVKPNMVSRRQLGNNNGVAARSKGLPSKTPATVMDKKMSAPVVKNIAPAHKPLPPKVHSSVPKQPLNHKPGMQEPHKAKIMPKQPVAPSRPQMSKPVKQISSHMRRQDSRPKKRPARRLSDDEDDEDAKALSMIRKMFNTQRYADCDDDDSDMEANYDDIMKEERLSEKIARKEDEEQLRLIEEEEQRELMRKQAKKRRV
ncbi:hypothetical protein K2173_020670 [Erythroxylum novogranatense]|uniref:SPT2 chromatin protein n=1 Tax=Erythroxylum novogranatense TaxID=1862640 RepID=A0AAV8TP37_9ROSI|nr:hypothetical protein K2173_020670 [Erythroxylum novogranatense]